MIVPIIICQLILLKPANSFRMHLTSHSHICTFIETICFEIPCLYRAVKVYMKLNAFSAKLLINLELNVPNVLFCADFKNIFIIFVSSIV